MSDGQLDNYETIQVEKNYSGHEHISLLRLNRPKQLKRLVYYSLR